MPTIKLLIAAIITSFLISCSGSSTYRGKWKAIDFEGNEVVLNFQAERFSILEGGDSVNYEYRQQSIEIMNGVETYGIHVKDKGYLELNFPIANDESMGLIRDVNGDLIWTICRTEYLTYQGLLQK